MSLWSVIGGIAGNIIAPGIGGGIGAALGGALDGKNSTNSAVGAQTAAANQANDTAIRQQQMAQEFQQRQLDQARADNEPWRTQGAAALGKLAAAPDFSFTGANVATDPGYQFGLNEGNRALTNSAAARGGLLSGAALKASTRYAQDYASTKFGEAYGRALQTDTANKNRLQTLAGIGQTAVGSLTSAGQQTGANVGSSINALGQTLGNNQLGIGNARASGYLANGNALTSAVNQGLSAWNNYNAPGPTGNALSAGMNSATSYNYTPTPQSTYNDLFQNYTL